MIERATARTIAVMLGVAILVALVAYGLWRWQHNAKQEARVAHSQADAVSQSAKDAIGVVGASGASERASDEQSVDSARTINAAEGANVSVAVPVRDAGIAALCRRKAYAGDKRCAN